jgi:SAM-dependent methyltransferase
MPFLTHDPSACETLAVPIAVLYPRFDHPAIEERYASWQTQMLLRSGITPDRLSFYDEGERAATAAEEIESEYVLVVTDPLVLPSPKITARLADVLKTNGTTAALPVTNETAHDRQRQAPPAVYLTLRELQAVQEKLETSPFANVERVIWDDSDPGLFLCRTKWLHLLRTPLRHVLSGAEVTISRTDYVHRWSSLRGQQRQDLLNLIPGDARSILEFGCGEATLGQALKQRQKCRVVGIELDRAAAAIAQKRIDDVFCADAREVISLIHEKFDWIIGGDIVEHLDEPWSFLAELRRIAAPGGRLLLSLPNIAHISVVNDLLKGRFDYVYMGLTCVGHLRFFTRQSIEEMLTIAGWTVVDIARQTAPETEGHHLARTLETAGYEFSRDDALATGYYVIAQNR